MKINWQKNKKGEWIGKAEKGFYRIELFKRPHGKWCYFLFSKMYKEKVLHWHPITGNGYLGTSLPTFNKAKSEVTHYLKNYHTKCLNETARSKLV